mgnify:CR=1 FL=1
MNLEDILKEAEHEFAAAANLPNLDQVKARFSFGFTPQSGMSLH